MVYFIKKFNYIYLLCQKSYKEASAKPGKTTRDERTFVRLFSRSFVYVDTFEQTSNSESELNDLTI